MIKMENFVITYTHTHKRARRNTYYTYTQTVKDRVLLRKIILLVRVQFQRNIIDNLCLSFRDRLLRQCIQAKRIFYKSK